MVDAAAMVVEAKESQTLETAPVTDSQADPNKLGSSDTFEGAAGVVVVGSVAPVDGSMGVIAAL